MTIRVAHFTSVPWQPLVCQECWLVMRDNKLQTGKLKNVTFVVMYALVEVSNAGWCAGTHCWLVRWWWQSRL
jgi:hypothetical protein